MLEAVISLLVKHYKCVLPLRHHAKNRIKNTPTLGIRAWARRHGGDNDKFRLGRGGRGSRSHVEFSAELCGGAGGYTGGVLPGAGKARKFGGVGVCAGSHHAWGRLRGAPLWDDLL